jgi:hypothetical protein
LPGVLLVSPQSVSLVVSFLNAVSGVIPASLGGDHRVVNDKRVVNDDAINPGPNGMCAAFLPSSGALYIAPTTSWMSCGAWETLLALVRTYSRSHAMTCTQTFVRRVICVSDACKLPMHAQHALRTIIERGMSSSFFVLTVYNQGCVDGALRSRMSVFRRPHYLAAIREHQRQQGGGGADVGGVHVGDVRGDVGGRSARSVAVLKLLEDEASSGRRTNAELREALARCAHADHIQSACALRGSVVGAADTSVLDRTWKSTLASAFDPRP